MQPFQWCNGCLCGLGSHRSEHYCSMTSDIYHLPLNVYVIVLGIGLFVFMLSLIFCCYLFRCLLKWLEIRSVCPMCNKPILRLHTDAPQGAEGPMDPEEVTLEKELDLFHRHAQVDDTIKECPARHRKMDTMNHLGQTLQGPLQEGTGSIALTLLEQEGPIAQPHCLILTEALHHRLQLYDKYSSNQSPEGNRFQSPLSHSTGLLNLCGLQVMCHVLQPKQRAVGRGKEQALEGHCVFRAQVWIHELSFPLYQRLLRCLLLLLHLMTGLLLRLRRVDSTR
ncbi:hypothetical protein INR49_026525 [Caranx melampygus]|nr:hypothetical protein INR49_026525 [Caranx melampygus]